MEEKICQSCGMPLKADPQHGGTNIDKSLSKKFCSFCYANGVFKDEGITLQDKIAKNVKMAVSVMNISEKEARKMAESILPHLERWK